ncbi:MAG: hypothetical protein J6Y74_03935 [Clostridia bacterium]|nr:hypothetical protein [Clostridia bacterium]
MEDFVALACAFANALIKGRSLEELLALQAAAQVVGAVINSAIFVARSGGK